MDDSLRDLARAAGVSPTWFDAFGRPQTVPTDALRAILGALGLPADSESDLADSLARARQGVATTPPLVTADAGTPVRVHMPGATGRKRWHVTLEGGGVVEGEAEVEGGVLTLPAFDMPGYHAFEAGGTRTTLAVAPARCFDLSDATGDGDPRLWGLAVQLYALRRQGRGTPGKDVLGEGGIGDFTALSDFARVAAAQGASALVLSPVHAPFSADTHHFSPYAPSSRLFLNALHADPSALFGPAAAAAAAASLDLHDQLINFERADTVQWHAAGDARLAVLRKLYEIELPRHADMQADFAAFRAEGGEALEDHARFEALHAKMFGSDPGKWHWRTWPEGFQDPRGAAVAAFARKSASEVGFYAFLQYAAARGLADAQAAARAAGMPIGLISDLAVGSDGGGSQAWSRPQDMLIGLSIGAPPDLLNSIGQAWGLSAFSPRAMVESGFRSFLGMLRATMAHAGGVRIDHIMGLMRLWMVPDGAKPSEGAYLAYPFDDLMRLVALESQRHRTIVTGEDLGTVPEGFREKLQQRSIMGMQVLWFERDATSYTAAADYRPTATAVTGTHDLPTIAGWWSGRDITWRTPLGLLGEGIDEAQERTNREADRKALWTAIGTGAEPASDDTEPVVDAAITYVGRTPAPLVVIPLEDALGLIEQPNLPGTVDEHPNWRRRFTVEAGQMLDAPEVKARLAKLDDARRDGHADTAGQKRRQA
ncbi:4-alpha-glucanotransferase [Azorhizobium oxalatiphilum]|uniref:4-alpha-glucanotransferase n=1 Tax=Azorhizobium oxalatiphilum TaxID=980631 RepID=A0A917BJ56_9HYPH|nr:4-alpha-glucanotransferase [Azorhizobium oxalatiphilum]GGF47136.1 4-alpha-glucanotransferase [Azorhizobium oxalatiphilum]